jgi:hypothetical protein
MILHANDFGCVPDGRFLERASLIAGSAVLTDLDGILRLTDVGKYIAIPGAVDLVTTIARLAEHREVRNAQMGAAGQDPSQLTGILFNPEEPVGQDEEPFLESVHIGRRITVAGAGPGGSTLVSDIVNIIDTTTIVLAHAASTPVTNARVILNRPDRVALDDYARRTVSNLSINLGDRTITDAEMTIGGRALNSESARFSSEDLGKAVTIEAAGVLVTTILSFQSTNQVTLCAPSQWAVTEGQADVWKTDSRTGLELLLSAINSLPEGETEIQFAPGVYDFRRSGDATSPINGVIGLRGMRDLTIRGSGAGVTVLRLMPGQDLNSLNTHVIETQDCRRLTFSDLSVHGAYLTMAKTNEQMHGIFLNEGSQEIIIERVRVFQTAGDGLRFLGRAENPGLGVAENKVRKVWVQGCQFVQNKRTGIGFQREVEQVWIQNCYIEMIPPSTDSCVDFEPTGNKAPGQIFASPTDIIIDSNFMKHGTLAAAVSISGIAGLDPTRRVKFTNNVVIGGEIFCTDVAQLTLQNNLVQVTNRGSKNRIPIQIQRGGDSVLITGNLLVNDDDTGTRAVISLSEVNQRQVRHALVADNLCFTRAGNGIECLSSNEVVIQGNLVVATDSCNHGILIRSESSGMDNISVRDNDITVRDIGRWRFGIRIAADPQPIGHVSITGNSIRGARLGGIVFQSNQFTQTPVCALNRIAEDVQESLSGIRNLPARSLIVGGAASRGGDGPESGSGRCLAGLGDPNTNNVPGNVGDIFQRLDGLPGATLYVKEAGNGTTTGWTAK